MIQGERIYWQNAELSLCITYWRDGGFFCECHVYASGIPAGASKKNVCVGNGCRWRCGGDCGDGDDNCGGKRCSREAQRLGSETAPGHWAHQRTRHQLRLGRLAMNDPATSPGRLTLTMVFLVSSRTMMPFAFVIPRCACTSPPGLHARDLFIHSTQVSNTLDCYSGSWELRAWVVRLNRLRATMFDQRSNLLRTEKRRFRRLHKWFRQ